MGKDGEIMKILITGGCGFVGTALVGMIIDRGHEVTVIDNLDAQQSPLLNYFHTGKLKFIYGDVTNREFFQNHLRTNKYDFIIPLAALVGMPLCKMKPELAYFVNTQQIKDILECRNPESKIIYTNTNSGYGMTDGKSECTEKSPLKPTSVYGITKCEAERIIRGSNAEYVIFRLATVFGCNQRIRTDLLVNHFVWKAVKDKSLTLFEHKFVRNFVHVRDVARAILFAMDSWGLVKNNVYNLGHPKYNITKLQLAEMIKKEVPDLEIIFREGRTDPDKRNYIVSNKKILSKGFKFTHSIPNGIKELVAAYGSMKDKRWQNMEDAG